VSITNFPIVTVIVYDELFCFGGVAESITVTMTLKLPNADGAPVIRLSDKLRPGGSEDPAAAVQFQL
jgi:hypothetical protein